MSKHAVVFYDFWSVLRSHIAYEVTHVQCPNVGQTRNYKKTTACVLIKLETVPDDGA
jgi:hypothetical protein